MVRYNPLCSLVLSICRKWFAYSGLLFLPIFFGLASPNLHAFSFSSLFGGSDKEKSSLARVAVLDFANTNNLSEYAYLSRSIADAIKVRLNQIFEYEKVSNRKVRRSFSSLLRKAKRKWYRMELLDIKAVAKKEKLDVVIYGSYKRIAKRKRGVDQVEVITSIYFAKKDHNIILDKKTSELNPKILTTSENIAEYSVDRIKAIIGAEEAEEEEEDESPAILVNVNVGENQSDSKKVRKEIEYIRRNLEKEHGQKVIFLPDYLDKNTGVQPPESVKKKSSLISWSKKYDIKKVIRVRVKIVRGLVQIDIIKEGKPQKEVRYELDDPPKVKKEKIKRVKKLLKIPKKKKKKVSLSVAVVSRFNWKDVSYEVGLNPFYQATQGGAGPISSLGGGFTLYFRTSLRSIIMLGKQASDKNNRSTANWFANSLFFGTHFSANYFQQTFSSPSGTADLFFQNYLVSFEASFLYPFTGELRAGLSLRPGYYIGFSSQGLGAISMVSTDETLYSGFVLPVFFEMSYLVSDRLALNIGVGDFMYDVLSTVSHGLSTFVGISYVFKR